MWVRWLSNTANKQEKVPREHLGEVSSEAKVAELQKATFKKGHWTLHGPPSNSWGSTAICQDSYMSLFHLRVFSESLPRNEICDDDVWNCGRAFLQVWVNRASSSQNHLQLKTVNVQLQAFDFEDDRFGNGELCHKHTLLRKCTRVVLSYFCLKLSKEQESLGTS